MKGPVESSLTGGTGSDFGSAQRKSASKITAEGLPVHSLTTLLEDLGTQALNTMHLPNNPDNCFTVLTQATPVQSRAFELLEVGPDKLFPVGLQF